MTANLVLPDRLKLMTDRCSNEYRFFIHATARLDIYHLTRAAPVMILPKSLMHILGLEFGVWGLGFGVWGLGFGVWGLGFGVWGLGFGVWGLGFGVWGLGFGVWGLGFGVWGLGFGV
jgi:hypothetical protein